MKRYATITQTHPNQKDHTIEILQQDDAKLFGRANFTPGGMYEWELREDDYNLKEAYPPKSNIDQSRNHIQYH